MLKADPNYVDPDITAFPRRDHTTRAEPINVVISRYNRDTAWAERFHTVAPVHIMVYDKCNPDNPYNVPVNKGNEASAYLKYVVDHYDNLPEFTFFVHDEEYSWHHSGSLIDKLQYALDSSAHYFNVNDLAFLDHISKNEQAMRIEWWRIHIKKYWDIPPEQFGVLNKRACAQFLVHRDNIRSMPKAFYCEIYKWLLETELSNYYNGRLFEWTWHLFWEDATKNGKIM